MFRKTFYIPYEKVESYPTIEISKYYISKYCEENKLLYEFIEDEAVRINGEKYDIIRGYDFCSHGDYIIKCRKS